MNSKSSAEISDETSYSVLNTAKRGLISGGITSMVLVALLWCWFFIRTTTVEEMEHLIGVDIFLMMVSVFIISITLLSGSFGGIIGGYIGYPSRQRGSVIGGVMLTITLIILSALGLNIGFSKYNEQETERAVATEFASLDLQIEQDPDNPEYYYQRALFYPYSSFDNRRERAIADYTKAIELDPSFIDAYYHRGRVCFEAGMWEQAITDYTQVIELNSYDNDFPKPQLLHIIYANRGDAYREVGQLEEALKDYEQALELRRDAFSEDHPQVQEIIDKIKALKVELAR